MKLNSPVVGMSRQRGSVTRTLYCFSLALILAGCSNNNEMIALQDYVNTVINRPPGDIEPPPEFITYDAFDYSAANLRSPFDLPVDASAAQRNVNNEVKPDLTRIPELLESYAIGSLYMVGTIGRGGQVSALVRDETSNVTIAGVGNYMGKNHGRIVEITELQINLVEIVPTGSGGWIERPQSITLQE